MILGGVVWHALCNIRRHEWSGDQIKYLAGFTVLWIQGGSEAFGISGKNVFRFLHEERFGLSFFFRLVGGFSMLGRGD